MPVSECMPRNEGWAYIHTHKGPQRTMVRHPQRESLVRGLRKAASKCGVQRVPQEAARPRVSAMMEAIRSSGGPEDAKAEAERLFATFEASFAADGLDPPEDGEGEGEHLERLRDLFEAAEGEEGPAGEGQEGDAGEGDYSITGGEFGSLVVL